MCSLFISYRHLWKIQQKRSVFRAVPTNYLNKILFWWIQYEQQKAPVDSNHFLVLRQSAYNTHIYNIYRTHCSTEKKKKQHRNRSISLNLPSLDETKKKLYVPSQSDIHTTTNQQIQHTYLSIYILTSPFSTPRYAFILLIHS